MKLKRKKDKGKGKKETVKARRPQVAVDDAKPFGKKGFFSFLCIFHNNFFLFFFQAEYSRDETLR